MDEEAIPEETKMSLVYIAGYFTRKDRVIRGTTSRTNTILPCKIWQHHRFFRPWWVKYPI